MVFKDRDFQFYQPMSQRAKVFVIKTKGQMDFLKAGSFQTFTGARWKFGRVPQHPPEMYFSFGSITLTDSSVIFNLLNAKVLSIVCNLF